MVENGRNRPTHLSHWHSEKEENIANPISKVYLVCDALATLFKNLVNLGSVTPEFKKGNDVHPVVYQRFGYEAPLLDLAVISSEFTVAITIQFCFTYTLEDATATR